MKEGGLFDELVFEIAAFSDKDWEELKTDFEGPQGYGHPEFDAEAHERKRQERMVRFTREFWFDITSFFGQGLVITDNATGEKKLLPPESFKLTWQDRTSGRPTTRALQNCDLIDPEHGVFSVLDLVTLRLGGPYLWHGEDIDDETAKGAIFRAYERDVAKEGWLDVASIMVVDASNDPTEPDVSTLEQDAVPVLDAFLHEGIRLQLAANKIELIQWMSSELNQSANGKALVTVYIVKETPQNVLHLGSANLQ